jgi:membrane protein DedA with SNARE-associated domain
MGGALRRILRATLLVAAALAVPILPLVVLGLSFEERVDAWFQRDLSAGLRFAMIAVVLALDLLLPVPSSVVSTYGGGVLGIVPATLASWLGMSVGAAIGFALARAFGEPVARKFSSAQDLQRMENLSRRFGPLALVLTRALPILAEACVLLMGAARLSWRQFLPPVLLANLAISLTYATFGRYFSQIDALPAAIVASAVIPLGIALLVRGRLLGVAEDGPPA